MSFVSRPEQMRTNATRSRCRGFMFAWILKTNPEKSGWVGGTRPVSLARGAGAGASVRIARRNGSTPKSLRALPKKTGVSRSRRYASMSKCVPAPAIIAAASIRSCWRDAPISCVTAGVTRVADAHRHGSRAPGAAFVQEDGVRLEVVDAGEVLAVAERPVDRRGRDPEHAFDLVQQLEGIERRLVHLVDERQHRQPARPADVEQLPGLGLDALRRVQHHDDAVHGEERPVGVLAEVLVAGRVEQRDMMPVHLELERGGADRDAALLFHLHPVGDGVPLRLASAHGARQLDRAGVQQQFLGQRRLAGVGVRDDRERPAAGDFARKGIGLAGRLGAGGQRSRIVEIHCVYR